MTIETIRLRLTERFGTSPSKTHSMCTVPTTRTPGRVVTQSQWPDYAPRGRRDEPQPRGVTPVARLGVVGCVIPCGKVRVPEQENPQTA